MCCRGRRNRQPPFVNAAVASSASAATTCRNQRKTSRQSTFDRPSYPNTLSAPDEHYNNAQGRAPPASGDAPYSPADKVPTAALESEASTTAPLPPPAYEEVAIAPVSMREVMPAGDASPRVISRSTFNTISHTKQEPVHEYPQEPHPAVRSRRERRGSSTSSLPSMSSSSSSDDSKDRENHLRNIVPGNVRPMVQPIRSSKKMAKYGRKQLKHALKRSSTMEEAGLIVLGNMGNLLRIDPNYLDAFAASEVDLSTAIVLSEWARKSAKSDVNVQELIQAHSYAEASNLIASRSRKVKLGKKHRH